MPWNDNSNNSGPWGGGSGGSGSGGGNGPRGPWGKPPPGGDNGGPQRGGQQPQGADLEDVIRQFQQMFGGRGGGGGAGGGRKRRGTGPLFLVIAVGLLAWVGFTGWYIVQPEERGVVLRFGAYDRTSQPGFYFKLPAPMERVLKPTIRVQQTSIGAGQTGGRADSLMLTGDENIVDIKFRVLWQISDAQDFLFNVRSQDLTVRSVAESAVREVVGKRNLEPIITTERPVVAQEAQDLIQATLDAYEAGIRVNRIIIEDASPPSQVIEAFQDVVNAAQDRERTINQAQQYRNDIVPRARGEAARTIQQAEGYRDSVIAEATGEAERFRLIYREYAQAPDVTRQRMYLETMEKVLAQNNKIVIDNDTGGIVPYLPLNELNRRGGNQ